MCKYILPSYLSKVQPSQDLEFPETSSLSHDIKITGLADAVGARVNVIVNNVKVCFDLPIVYFPRLALNLSCASFLASGH